MKKTWRQITKIRHKNKHKDKIFCIKTRNKLESDLYLIGNTFNKYFTTVNTDQNFSKLLDKRQENAMFLNPVTKNETEICIK